jgi:hypothetical protein
MIALVGSLAACSSGGSGASPASSSGVGSAAPSGGSAASSSAPATAAAFSADITNPWFPFPVGRHYTYVGSKDGKKAVDKVVVTDRTRVIDGAPCRLVRDLLYLDGVLEERTTDFYTQAADGTVWYYGEETAELDEHGAVTSTEGSWMSGVDGAKAGVMMPADPRVGQSMAQERYPGHAEDFFRILDLGASVAVPYATASDALLTKEWTPLEPDVVDHKYYLRGVGMVKESTVKGPKEENALTEVTPTG